MSPPSHIPLHEVPMPGQGGNGLWPTFFLHCAQTIPSMEKSPAKLKVQERSTISQREMSSGTSSRGVGQRRPELAGGLA